MDWSYNNPTGSLGALPDGALGGIASNGEKVVKGNNMRWGRIILLFIAVSLTMILSGILSRNVYAESKCYSITYHVGDKTGQTNSI